MTTRPSQRTSHAKRSLIGEQGAEAEEDHEVAEVVEVVVVVEGGAVAADGVSELLAS